MSGEVHPNTVERVAAHLERRGRVCLRVHGTSMLPWVRPRDIVLVRHATADAVRCGDLVLFARNGQLFLHRVIEKKEAAGSVQLVTKGDAHPHPDMVVAQQEFLGRIVRIHRGRRPVDLDAPWQLALGILTARISAHSRKWYPLARIAGRAAIQLRKVAATFRTAEPKVKTFLRLVIGISLLFPGPVVRADEVTNLSAVADSYFEQGDPMANFGANTSLRVQSESANNFRSILRFNVAPGIPAGSAIKTSILKLVVTATGGTRTHAAHRVTGDPQWTETGVTWNRRTTTANWTAAGGDFFATAVDSRSTGAVGTTVSWTVRTDGGATNIPQGWLDGAVANLGLLIKDAVENGTGQQVSYGSRENLTAANRPVLEVHYLRDVTLGSSTPGISEVTWSWTFPIGSTSSNYDGAMFAKKLGTGASFVFSPADSTIYPVGQDLGNSESVAINTSAFATVSGTDENGADSVVLPATAYTFRAFTHDAATITGAATPAPPHYAFGTSGNVTTLTGGGINKNWSYKTGAATLAPPGLNPGATVVTGSNDGKVHSMSATNGGRNYRPVAPIGTTGGAIQSRPPLIPSDSTTVDCDTGTPGQQPCDVVYVGAGDGKVYAFNATTGAKLWESAVLALGGGSIQGGAAVQVKAFSNASFTPTTDLVIVGTRNVGAGSDTNNSVVALNGNTGAVVWTFVPGNLDIINSTPYVDLTNNVVWVTSRAGLLGTQPSLWKLDSSTGALLASFNLGNIDGSPSPSTDGKVIYAVTLAGSLNAVRTDLPSCTLSTNPSTGTGVGFAALVMTGPNAEDIFFSTSTTVNKVHFDYAAVTCTGTFTTPATGWTNPVIASPSTPIYNPPQFLYVGSSDGRLYKIDPSNGTILGNRLVRTGATVGDPSFDVVSLKLYVGDTSGRIYSFDQF